MSRHARYVRYLLPKVCVTCGSVRLKPIMSGSILGYHCMDCGATGVATIS